MLAGPIVESMQLNGSRLGSLMGRSADIADASTKSRAEDLRAENEGHGFARKENADFLFYAMVKFVEQRLLQP